MSKKITQMQILYDDGTIDIHVPDMLGNFLYNGMARILRGGVKKIASVTLTDYGEIKTYWTDDTIRKVALETLKKQPWEEEGYLGEDEEEDQ